MSALIHPKTITVDGLSVRYAEGGQDGPDAILMSPWPESVYAFGVADRQSVNRDCLRVNQGAHGHSLSGANSWPGYQSWRRRSAGSDSDIRLDQYLRLVLCRLSLPARSQSAKALQADFMVKAAENGALIRKVMGVSN